MAQSEPRKKALVIAVSKYDYFDPLPFCENDGKEMIKTLKKLNFEIPESRQLTGIVNHEKMSKAIKEFFRGDDVNSTDILLFYYSGHGTPYRDNDYYFVTTETRMDKPDVDGYEYEDLTKLSSNSTSEKIIKIIDCCYSGALKTKGNEQAHALVGKRAIEDKSSYEGKGNYLLASSLATQQSYGMSDKQHSEFTYHIIQGLNGVSKIAIDLNGHITPHTLGIYVDKMMRGFPKDQRPIIKTEGSGEISLAQYPQFAEPKPKPTPSLTPISHFPVNKARIGRFDTQYEMAFLKENLVFINVGHDKKRALAKGAAEQAVIAAFGFMPAGYPVAGFVIKKINEKTRKKDAEEAATKFSILSNLGINDLLKLDKTNFVIPFHQISKIKIKQAILGTIVGEIEIHTEKKEKFQIPEGQNFESCVKMLESYLPGKIEYKKIKLYESSTHA